MSLLFSTGVIAASTSPEVEAFDLITNVSISAAVTTNIDNCFSADYDTYLIVGQMQSGINSNDVLMRLRTGGSTDSGSNYVTQSLAASDTTITTTRSSAIANITLGLTSSTSGDGDYPFMWAMISNPFKVARTTFQGWDAQILTATPRIGGRGALHTQATSYDGLTILTGTNTLTGSIQIYGWKV